MDENNERVQNLHIWGRHLRPKYISSLATQTAHMLNPFVLSVLRLWMDRHEKLPPLEQKGALRNETIRVPIHMAVMHK